MRALYGHYRGSLYQVTRASDHTTRDIGLLNAGGFADGAAQDAFCSGTTCVTSAVYDQSGNGNDLWYQGSSVVPGSTQSSPATATTESLHPSGNKVYSLYVNPGNSYWRNGSQSGVPTGSQPEGLYMVTSGTRYNAGCCFDYGNSETDRKADGAGAMDAINFGNECWFSSTAPCTGSGPWVQADLEYGLWAGGSQSTNPANVPMTGKYVTAMLKNNGTAEFALKGGDAQSGNLTMLYKGSLPSGYSPMKNKVPSFWAAAGTAASRAVGRTSARGRSTKARSWPATPGPDRRRGPGQRHRGGIQAVKALRSDEAFTSALESGQRALLRGDSAAAEVDFLRALAIARVLGKADRDLRELRAWLWQAIDPRDAWAAQREGAVSNSDPNAVLRLDAYPQGARAVGERSR